MSENRAGAPVVSATGPHRAGIVSIFGRPNAGKSTLLNALTGAKLAIVSDKPQTTRIAIQGVLTLPGAQIVFVDTPGIHKSDTVFNRRMMGAVRAALDSLDAILFIVDVTRPFEEADAQAVDLIKKSEASAILVLNKIDRLKGKAPLLALIEQYRLLHDFADYVPISATTGEGLDLLRSTILRRIPEGPPLYPEGHLTDQPKRFLAAETIREKILLETRQEVPHSVAVLVDHWQDGPRILRIAATIYVEKEGQKGIIIGSRGAMLKQIGTLARQEIESFFEKKVFLELFVKVRPNWRENLKFLNELDWRKMAGTENE